MTIQIERPRDLPLATTLVDSDLLVIDQGAGGVKRIPVGFVRSILSGGTYAGYLSGTVAPAMVTATVPGIYLRIDTGVREWWINPTGAADAWELWLKAQ